MTFAGGSKDNAIPRECAAEVLFLTAAEAEAAAEQARAEVREIAAELPLEPDFDCAVTVEAEREARALSPSESRTLVGAVCLVPNGVRRRDPRVPEAVVASLNLGIVRLEAAEARLVFSPRSSVDSLQRETESLLALLAEAFGFSVETAGRYPGWAYAEHSPVRGVFRDCYRQLFGEELRFEHMHAGLECGLFAAAMPGLDAIAVGPTILGVHTPDDGGAGAAGKGMNESRQVRQRRTCLSVYGGSGGPARRKPFLSKVRCRARSVGTMAPIRGRSCRAHTIPPTVPTAAVGFPRTQSRGMTERGSRISPHRSHRPPKYRWAKRQVSMFCMDRGVR